MRGPVSSRNTTEMRRIIGLLFLMLAGGIASAEAQGLKTQQDFSLNPEWFPRVYKPYVVKKVPDVELENSALLTQLSWGGKLPLSISQLKTAVSENNLDILSSNNGALYSETDMLRVKGGGAPRGGAGVQIPSSLFAGAIGAGVGGFGGLGGFGGAGGITGGARQVSGFTRGSYDPTLAIGFSMDRTNSPLNSIVVSGLPEVTTASTALQTRYSQAFSTGASISIGFNNMRQSSTQQFLRFNPSFVSQFSISITQQLLSGFGRAVGRRFLEVAENEKKVMKEVVRLQVNTTLAQAKNLYWDLVAAQENARVAEESLAVAQRLYEDNQKREEIGTASGLDVITAESEIASRQRDLVSTQTTVQMREADLKNAISKNVTSLLDSVQIVPTDRLPDPQDSDIPKLSEAQATAVRNRPEITQAEVNLQTQDIAIRYEKDLLKPTLLVFANFNSSGLYGNQLLNGVALPGGLSQAFRQVRSWSYPEYAFGFSFNINLRNRAAQADDIRAKLEKQQSETNLQHTRNNIMLEVRKAIIGLVQAKAQVEAARNAAKLSRETLAAEEVRLLEGVSIPYDVIRRQRDYSSAQFAEIQARANYAKALVERDRAMGILEPK
jgi:outer membrane protein TolC